MEAAGLLLRVVVSIVSVLGLVWLFSRGMTRGRGRRLVPGMTEVLSRQALSRAASVVVVRVGEKALVLGVTEQSVQVLGEADPLLLAAEQALTPAVHEVRTTPGWGPLLDALQSRTVRRS